MGNVTFAIDKSIDNNDLIKKQRKIIIFSLVAMGMIGL